MFRPSEYPRTRHGTGFLRASQTIAIVASDQGLLRSLVFSLEVEGFSVVAAERWRMELHDRGDVACFIVDANSLPVDDASRASFDRHRAPVIFLADGYVAAPERAGVHALSKPFHGGDLTALLRQIVGPGGARARSRP